MFLAFNLEYFSNLNTNDLKRKLRLYPKEIKDAWENIPILKIQVRKIGLH